jgi:hypothetical protein
MFRIIYKLFLVVRHNIVLAISRKLARNELNFNLKFNLNLFLSSFYTTYFYKGALYFFVVSVIEKKIIY